MVEEEEEGVSRCCRARYWETTQWEAAVRATHSRGSVPCIVWEDELHVISRARRREKRALARA